MTKSTITRERIQRIIRAINSEAYDEEEIREWLSSDEIMELSRMALAAMDSEPVAWLRNPDQGFHLPMLRLGSKDPNPNFVNEEFYPVYAVPQPAPVAHVCTCPSGDGSLRWPCQVHPGSSPVIPDGYVMVPKEPTKEMLDEFDSIIDYGAEDSQDAWRRLLAAAPQSPGSEPATVPGKWIPVSERMPEVGVKVLCFPVKDEPIHATFNGQLWLQDISWSGSDEPIDNVIPTSVTHWMPLPAAPQEVSDA